ncbi:MAG: GAF domain-containing protein [Anaerolineae bacterium]|nr:GAF domain-containing protein [Anaerolineae bacterium]
MSQAGSRQHERRSAFDFLVETARQLTACGTAAEALQTLTDRVQGYWQPAAVSLARVEDDGGLVFCAASGGMADRVIGLSLPAGTGIVGWVAEHGRRLWAPNVHTDDRFYGEIDRLTGFTTRAILAVPLMVGGDVLAVLEFINPEPNTDMAAVDDVVAALSLLAAPAIANVRLMARADQAERRYKRLFELNLDPIVVLDQDGRITEANRMAQSALGVSVSDPGGPRRQDPAALARLGFNGRSYSELGHSARTQGAITWDYQLPGEERYMEARLSYLPDGIPGGELYLWIGHDVTDRVDLESARQKFIHMIVHDLRAPLSSVQNSLELVLTAWREQDVTMPIEQVLGIGLRSANRMERLISDILDSAALQARERTLEISRIEVPALISEALETVMTSANRRDQDIRVALAPDLPVILGDADLLRRVLINLLSNAVKFTQDEGMILVQAKVVSGAAARDEVGVSHPADGAPYRAVRFSITDNGPGISPDIRDNLFKLYVHTSDRRTKGSGIGLAFCKLAVEAHGGRIWFESPVPEEGLAPLEEAGKGTRFTFVIPLVPPNHTGEGEALPG